MRYSVFIVNIISLHRDKGSFHLDGYGLGVVQAVLAMRSLKKYENSLISLFLCYNL